jgi:hypothetical protein
MMLRKKLPNGPFQGYKKRIELLPIVNRLFTQGRCYLYYERDIPPEEFPDLVEATDILVRDFMTVE